MDAKSERIPWQRGVEQYFFFRAKGHGLRVSVWLIATVAIPMQMRLREQPNRGTRAVWSVGLCSTMQFNLQQEGEMSPYGEMCDQ